MNSNWVGWYGLAVFGLGALGCAVQLVAVMVGGQGRRPAVGRLVFCLTGVGFAVLALTGNALYIGTGTPVVNQ